MMCAGITSALGLSLVVGAGASLFDIVGLYMGHLPLWSFVRPASVITACLAVATFAFAALAWAKNSGPLLGRIYFTVLAVADLAFVWFLSFWNLLGKGF